MKRIVLTGAALAGLLTAGAGVTASVASAARTKTKTVTTHKTETKNVKISASCKLTLAAVPPPGQTGVLAGNPTASTYGTSGCSGIKNGKGVAALSYTESAAGNLTGTLQSWFKAGTIYGTYTLTPAAASGPPTATSFAASSFAGTFKVTGAGGQLKGSTGTGTLTCTTPDSLHYNCKESLTLTQPVTTTVTVNRKVEVA